MKRRKPGADQNSMGDVTLLSLFLEVRVQSIIDPELRREYYQRLSPVLTGEQFESVIAQTEGFSFAQLRETYILGAQSAFEHGREVGIADVIEAIEVQAAGAQDLKTSVASSGFVLDAEPSRR